MNSNCTVFRTADFIGKRWTLPIILELYKGSSKWKRYSHLKKSLPNITPKILSARLKELESQGILIKNINANSFPIKSNYKLTSSGEDFISIIMNIKGWALKWKFKNKECEKKSCKECQL